MQPTISKVLSSWPPHKLVPQRHSKHTERVIQMMEAVGGIASIRQVAKITGLPVTNARQWIRRRPGFVEIATSTQPYDGADLYFYLDDFKQVANDESAGRFNYPNDVGIFRTAVVPRLVHILSDGEDAEQVKPEVQEFIQKHTGTINLPVGKTTEKTTTFDDILALEVNRATYANGDSTKHVGYFGKMPVPEGSYAHDNENWKTRPNFLVIETAQAGANVDMTTQWIKEAAENLTRANFTETWREILAVAAMVNRDLTYRETLPRETPTEGENNG